MVRYDPHAYLQLGYRRECVVSGKCFFAGHEEIDMEKYKIFPLWLGTITRARSHFSLGLGDDTLADFPVIAYLLKGVNKSYLVDTGGTPPDGIRWMPYKQKKEENLEEALSAIGVSLEEINSVIITHLHWDHVGALHLFPDKELYVQKKELDYWYEQSKKPGFNRELDFTLNYKTLDGDEWLFDGIKAYLMPGHSPGMQAVWVNTVDGPIIIGSDLIPVFANYQGGKVWLSGSYSNLDELRESTNRILEMNLFILPGHDRAVFDKVVYG